MRLLSFPPCGANERLNATVHGVMAVSYALILALPRWRAPRVIRAVGLGLCAGYHAASALEHLRRR